jgi:hypothetical protein
MTRRFVFFTLAAGLLALSLGGTESRAGSATLDQLIGGATLTEGDLTFSNFSYTPTPTGSPPIASAVDVTASLVGGLVQLEFDGGFHALANTTVDYLIKYEVTAAPGDSITDAHLFGNPLAGSGGMAAATVTETINALPVFGIDSATPSASVTFAPQSTIFVTKDILMVGGTTGTSSLSFVQQSYSTTAIPEPASMALLGIGLSGLFTLRRFFKRTSVA